MENENAASAAHLSEAVELREDLFEPGDAIIANFEGFENGGAIVRFNYSGNMHRIKAMSAVKDVDLTIGKAVVLLFAQGIKQPMIIGLLKNQDTNQQQVKLDQLLQSWQSDAEDQVVFETGDEDQLNAAKLLTDSEHDTLHISAKDKIVFSCGESSITLTKAGKILIRGKYVQSRSTGVNRILGGSVQVN